MLHNKELEETIGFRQREEEFMRKFFLDRVQEESVLSGQAFLYLHYADMIANGYKRTMPCPFQSQGLLLNPNGDLHYCENSEKIGNVLDDAADALYYKAENLMHREQLKDEGLPDLPEPVPGQRRRDEAVRPLCEVPEARLPGQAGSRAARGDAARAGNSAVDCGLFGCCAPARVPSPAFSASSSPSS